MRFEGELLIPPSKSYSQRALALSLLCNETTLHNIGNSDDELAVIDILKQLNSEIKLLENNSIQITNHFDFNQDVAIHCNESGLSARLFSTLMMLNRGTTTINGNRSLLNRTMSPLYSIYEQLGIEHILNNDKLPISIKGNISPKSIEVDGKISSQFISGLLYYYVGLNSSKSISLSINNITSRPYINMTIDLLNTFGAQISWKSYNILEISPAQIQNKIEYKIESDWSSAAFWIVAAAIDGNLVLKGLNIKSLQADKTILDVVRIFGADLRLIDNDLEICSNQSFAFEFDATDCPDLIPILSVLALFGDGISTIEGTKRLIHKESNRLLAIENMLNQVGASYEIFEDKIRIQGNSFNLNYTEIVFNSFDDHRIAMSSILLGEVLKLNYTISNTECINKSYPQFLNHLKSIIK